MPGRASHSQQAHGRSTVSGRSSGPGSFYPQRKSTGDESAAQNAERDQAKRVLSGSPGTAPLNQLLPGSPPHRPRHSGAFLVPAPPHPCPPCWLQYPCFFMPNARPSSKVPLQQNTAEAFDP